MKTYKISFHTKHRPFCGAEYSEGWSDYIIEAKNSKAAKKKATLLWYKEWGSPYTWVERTIINQL